MTKAENITRLEAAIAERNQPAPISMSALRKEAEVRRDQVLDRLAVVRIRVAKNEEERDHVRADADAKIAALEESTCALKSEATELTQMADAMLTEMHAFDRLMQGK